MGGGRERERDLIGPGVCAQQEEPSVMLIIGISIISSSSGVNQRGFGRWDAECDPPLEVAAQLTFF